jgi:flagellar M-ring protein FliF
MGRIAGSASGFAGRPLPLLCASLHASRETVNQSETINRAIFAGSGAEANPCRVSGWVAVQGLLDFLRTLGAARMAAMAAVTLALVAFFAFVIVRATAPQMTPLFTDLAPADSGAIVKELERQGIAYELRGDGETILVPKDQVGRLRMKLAEGGLPKGGGVGYEIFDKSDVLGATSFVQNINRLRALEGELARTIQSIDRVQAARVHLVLPERPLFSRDKVDPSASIVLKVVGTLAASQVRAIRHLVASAVSGLRPERISIVDEAGELLADGSGNDEASLEGEGALERRHAFERRLREQVESIVTSVVGPGRARVQLSAEFDLNRITQTSDTFDPDGRVVRSSQTREESTSNGQQDGQVTVGNELPGGTQRGEGSSTNRDQSKKTEETVNYEISHTTKTEVVGPGRVKRISAAVLVDGTYAKNEKGESVYRPRSKEEMDRIAALVRTAIGYDQKRGDQVEVVNLRFAEAPVATLDAPAGWMSMFTLGKADLMRGFELLLMGLLSVLVIVFVVRPLVGRIIAPDERAAKRMEAAPGMAALAAAPPSAGALPVGSPAAAGPMPMPSIAPGEAPPPITNETAMMIDIAQVRGQVHAQSVQKVGELADTHPHEAVAIIRHWLHDSV